MEAWNDLQRDLESRKYKSNPFEKKYVDLTISSCVAGNPSSDDSSGLDHLSKSIRARSEIISCQIDFLVKEAMHVVLDISGRAIANTSGKARNNLDFQRESSFFIGDDELVDFSRRSLMDYLGDNTTGKLPEEVMSAKLPWLDELVRALDATKLKEIMSPFLFAQPLSNLRAHQEIKKSTATSFNGSFTEVLLLQK